MPALSGSAAAPGSPRYPMMGAFVEGAAPFFHDGDEARPLDFQQTGVVGRVVRDHLAGMLGAANRLHAALPRRVDELRVIILNEALGRIDATSDAPQQQPAHIRGMAP